MHTTKLKLDDTSTEVCRIAPGCLLNTQWHGAKTVGVPSEEGFSACENFHTKLEMTAPIFLLAGYEVENGTFKRLLWREIQSLNTNVALLRKGWKSSSTHCYY